MEETERERRQALAAFLRTRRARLSQAEVGLPARSRRRTPGLRREDVAELANIGVSWYTLLEQGQEVHPSMSVLESIAQALRLTPAEEQHLFRLSGHTLPAKAPAEEEEVPLALRRTVDALTPHPAFVIGRRWDVLFWNRAAGLLFRFDEPFPPHSLNVVWRYLQLQGRSPDLDWEVQMRNLVAQFRADYARYPGDASFEELLHDLQDMSPLFREWWEQQDVRGLPNGPRSMIHPALGLLEFDHVTFQASFSSDLRVKVYAASPATASKLEQALSATS
ncbi:helix-turn-helix transcriptional regulator [Dictyobacter aurantiacus]|uniref:Transcriptional regulator n=1 Tax=Dictyobacter aurantiacus TaxID=1936993 RepID=A0A401ZT92_9CHLR|nr:helix-turn-helix transcriptional regulator [Dictyobacter aurantiacus]GCE07743.1 transcriptional regulator [Dictyobacter aurantiacus]GCE10109.1 transcriptional regulator [Dictyobacter aurantiacus]